MSEKDTLMPMIDKGTGADGFEGAIVLEPKCNLYLDNPVACVDYSSLYPSSIISENISHDSKVWTKTYDLNGNILKNKTWGKEIKMEILYMTICLVINISILHMIHLNMFENTKGCCNKSKKRI